MLFLVFTLGWGVLLLGAMVTTAQNLGYLPMNAFTNYAAQIGTLFELSLLSLNLAYAYNILYKKLQTNEKALVSLTTSLEEKVQTRTQELDEKNKELKVQINNKNTLFKELYHRVKNNLQIVSSLLYLQSDKVENKVAKEAFFEMTNRIKSISLIHERLYGTGDLSHIDMQEYTKELVHDLQQATESEGITFEVDCKQVILDLEMSIPLGLIINELVTNAIKYAFTPKMNNETIRIAMQQTQNHTLTLEVSDNGQGANMKKLEAGFGFKLVQSLAVYQLGGHIQSNNTLGVHHKMTFILGEDI